MYLSTVLDLPIEPKLPGDVGGELVGSHTKPLHLAAFGPGSNKETARQIAEPEETRRRYLPTDQIERPSQSLERLMREDKLYLQEDLRLEHLAFATGFSLHQVSEYLNQDLGKTFREYVNEYRVRHAATLLQAESDLNILNIAYESGFNSKSTFHAAFHKQMGVSPTEFRRNANSHEENQDKAAV